MLRIERLTKKYGDKKAVDDLSLHIQKGEIYGFIGHNGAGKTTTIKSCCGILNFDEGEIYVDGVSVKEKPLECKRKIAYIPDNPDLYEFMTGIKYLNFIADIFGISQSDRQARISASLAGSIMDDWLRYQDNGWDTDSSAWAQRVNYAAKLSNFNAVNMGQISDESIGAVSWRYTASKGGQGAQNVNDGGTRAVTNGWNDFSGESEEGLYGSSIPHHDTAFLWRFQPFTQQIRNI